MTNETDFSGAVNQSPGMNEREGVRRPISFIEAMDVVERGFKNWMAKPHNRKWLRRIEGTPIPNDIAVNIAEAICDSTLSSTPRAPAPSAWQPIETAPKDGTFIHVWFPDNGDDPASQCLTCSWKLLPESGLTKGAWFAQSGGRAFRMGGATHWKPMDSPSLPSSDRGGVG